MADHSLNYIQQSTDNTCWAASTAMMMNKSSDMEVVREMKEQYPDSVWDDGATELELGQVAQAYGLSQVYPVCQGPAGWDEWLTNSPLLIQVPGNSHHSIVVAGIQVGGDNQEEQVSEASLVHVLDPWHSGGGDRWVPFDEFNQQYELAGDNWSNNVYSW